MTADRRYFFYSVIQYVHDTREERLNVGIVVHDPLHKRVIPCVSVASATRRLRSLYRDIDRVGLQLYLEELVRGVPADERIQVALTTGTSPLDVLEREWTHLIQFTPARMIPAVSPAAAVAALTHRYLNERPRGAVEREPIGALERTKVRTRDAISRVLHMVPGQIGFSDLHLDYVENVGGRTIRFPLEFPFLLFEDYAVDTVSLEADYPKEMERQADYFIRKVERLRAIDRYKQPHATVSLDPQRRELSLDLVAYMRAKTQLNERELAVVEDAETVAETIKEKHERVA